MDNARVYEWQNEIMPRLHVGGAPFYRGVANYDTDEFDTIVLCADNFQYEGREWLFGKDVKLLRCPFVDGHTISAAEWRTIRHTANTIASRYKQGETVLVTCAAGINRSALVMALALLEIWPEMSAEQVIDTIRRRRKLDYGEALFNQKFVDLIYDHKKAE